MTAALAVLLQLAACVGGGMAILTGLGLAGRLDRAERLGWGIALGLGLLGWLMFFLAWLDVVSAPAVGGLLAILAGGLALLGRPAPSGPESARPPLFLLALAAVIFLLTLTEAAAPPSDGDTLAYHFALPKLFMGQGGLVFVPRAVDGAVPLLVHMTYLSALTLGGESALPLWSALSSWGMAAFLWALARPWLGNGWALAWTLVFATTPAAIYGWGSGQVEVRLALFVLAGTMAAARAVTGADRRWAVVAGLAAGFFLGAKFTGLLFAVAVGVPIVLCRSRLRLLPPFVLAALLVGTQWYGWLWAQTGDPLFPLLSRVLGYPSPQLWSAAFDDWFRAMWSAGEMAIPGNPLWMLAYPFLATLAPAHAFDAGRVGFGPALWLVLPFALAGAWAARKRLWASPLTIVLAGALGFGSLWFLLGSSQRLRHFLPILPALLLAGAVAAHHWAQRHGEHRPLVVALAIALALQTAVLGLYHARNVGHVLSGAPREAYLRGSISYFDAFVWLNGNLGPGDKVLVGWRGGNYLLDVAYYHAHPFHQGLVDLRPSAELGPYYQQLRLLGITHILLTSPLDAESSDTYTRLAAQLHRQGCAEIVATIPVTLMGSRTLPGWGRETGTAQILRLPPQACAMAPLHSALQPLKWNDIDRNGLG
jgi:hypothetical protein